MKALLSSFAVAAVACAASGAIITPGTYHLANHPGGSALPPAYGLRLDELYNATGNHDIYTFDFSALASDVRMTVSATTIRIFGQSFGGRDTGSGYANDIDRGIYTFDFIYSVGVQNAPGDDDIMVIANHQNFGTITTPRGHTIALEDQSDGNYSFRLGDENNDLGHRGFSGISGWGWMNHGGDAHVYASDWLFTVDSVVPAPSSLAAVAFGALAMARRRR